MLAYSSDLYSVKNSETKVSELIWPDDQQLSTIQVFFQHLVSDWCVNWLGSAASVPKVIARLAHDSDADFVLPWRRVGDQRDCFWVANFSELKANLSSQIFKAEACGSAGSLQAKLEEDAVADFINRFAQALRIETDARINSGIDEKLRLNEILPWSGSVHVSIPFLKGTTEFLIAWDVLMMNVVGEKTSSNAKLASQYSPAKLSKLSDALNKEPVFMTVEMSPAELDILSIRNLCVGDVIRLGHSLDEPLSLKTETGEVVCFAYLGKHADHKAIELIRSL